MTAGATADDELAELLRALCGAPGEAVAETLGALRPSERAARFLRVEPTRFAAIGAVELRPWADEYGIALPELARDARWSLPGLEQLLGPLAEGVTRPGSGLQLEGSFDDPALPARAAVSVILAAGGAAGEVAEVRIRTEPR